MNGQWFYVHNGSTAGPVGADVLARLAAEGVVLPMTYVWQEGMPSWVLATDVPGLLPPPGAVPLPPIPAVPLPPPAVSGRSILGQIGVSISHATELPTLSGVPIREVLLGGLQPGVTTHHIEDLFIVGTETTTPDVATLPSGWPTPRVFWRIFAVSVAAYLLLMTGLRQFGNLNFLPGMIVLGAFVVPLSVVVLFFELNVPRNVSVYQVAKMILFGGALSLFVTMIVSALVPGDGSGSLIPAMLTGVVEELGKALVLLLLVASPRYRFQLNGLLFGAAVGAGFAGFESAGYALLTAIASNSPEAASGSILIRGLLAPGGHVIWTAMVGAALWKVKGGRPFEIGMLFHPVVVRRWLTAVVLHGLWDTDLPLIPPLLKCALLLIVGWYIVFAMLKQALAEVETAKTAAVEALTRAA
ncbi:MAG: PrsW family glutamic-type intramembrane protease [Acidobacteriota bacterium]